MAINLQRSASLYNGAYKHFEMQVYVKKMKIFIQPAPGQATPDISINIDGQPVEVIDDFA